MNLYRKRKFTIALLSLGMSFVLALIGVVAGSEWVTAVSLIMGLYGAANVGEHMAKRNQGEDEDDPDIKPVD